MKTRDGRESYPDEKPWTYLSLIACGFLITLAVKSSFKLCFPYTSADTAVLAFLAIFLALLKSCVGLTVSASSALYEIHLDQPYIFLTWWATAGLLLLLVGTVGTSIWAFAHDLLPLLKSLVILSETIQFCALLSGQSLSLSSSHLVIQKLNHVRDLKRLIICDVTGSSGFLARR